MSVHQPGRYLRTNYRLTGGKIDYGALESILYHFRVSYQLDSGGNGVVTLSMNGLGIPSMVWVRHASHHDGWASGGLMIGNISISDASIVYVSIGNAFSNSIGIASGGTSIPMTSLPATVTLPFAVMALIASR